MATPTRNEMIEWLAVYGPKTGNTTASTVRTYYQHQPESIIQQDFTRELTKLQAAYAEARRNLPESAELKAAESAAAAAIAARDQAYSDMIWSQITNVVINGMQVDATTANRNIIAGWLHDGEHPSGEWFRKIIVEEQPALARRISWHSYVSSKAEQQQNAAIDIRTLDIFFDVARRLNISHSQANQASVLAAYPDGVLDANQLEQDINSGKISLHAAGSAEAEQFKLELINLHNQRWKQVTKNMSVQQIKEVSARERAERESLVNRITPEARRHVGVEPLPAAITAEKIQNASRETIALWRAKYSITSINDRIQGLS
jgi:hypothetical protein